MQREADAKSQASVETPSLPAINPIVPRRAPGVMGRRPYAFGDLNYQVLAPAVGVSPTHLGRILNGINRPSMTVASKLAAMFGWTLDQINQIYERKNSATTDIANRAASTATTTKPKTKPKGIVNRHAKSNDHARKR